MTKKFSMVRIIVIVLIMIGLFYLLFKDSGSNKNYKDELYFEIVEITKSEIYNEETWGELISSNALEFRNYTGAGWKYFTAMELASNELINYYKEINSPTQYYLRIFMVIGSDNVYVGKVQLFSSADPPMSIYESYFKITPETIPEHWKVETYGSVRLHN
jgi:hypothetical protein